VPTAKTPARANDTKNGPEKGIQKKQEKVKDPIGLLSGAFELRHVDLSFPGAVRPLEFVRTYDSKSRDRSVLGSNWNHNWDVRLVPLNDENRPSWADPYCAGSPHETTCIMLYVGDTPQLYYREFMTGTFVPQNGASTGTLVPLESTPGTPDSRTGWMLESADGHNLTFDTDGYLTRDVDRFGNGFSIEYELTANGRLFAALCPPGIVEMAPNPSDPSSIIIRPQQGPIYNSEALDCRALGSVSGVRSPIARRPTGSPTLHFQLPPQPPQALSNAKTLVERLQNTNGRQPGSPMPWGARLKRVTRVSEIVATTGSSITATGRELAFEYFGSSSNLAGSSSLTSEGLLRAVSGPAGARIEFTYASAEGSANHPVFLNEAFLTEARRNDGPNNAGVAPTPVRSLRFTYAWLKNTLAATAVAQIRTRFEAFFLAQVNCTYTPVDNCGQKRPPALIETDVSAELEDIEASFRAEVVDNIIRVEDGLVVESETRYDVDPFSTSFDRAVRQRWGSTYATPMPSSAPDWDTTLPEGELRFAEATPVNGGQDDSTTTFLPLAIRNRYGLEPIPTGAPLLSARASGMLLEPNAPDGTVIPGQNPPIAEGTLVPAVGSTRPACALQKLPILRSRLPGYRPSFDYYDLVAQTPDPDSATQGINVETFELQRSRLSCELLTRAQTYDARSNDLLWTWQNDANGQMVANRSLGRRKFITLNANRICAWVHDIDRDGNSKYLGLNFQGRPLVDAARGADGVWRFAETLYNADGNVIAQRRPLPEGTAWNASRGDTRFSYLDTVQPSNPAQPLPWHWARRGNVIRVTERPRGGTVQEAVETVGNTSTVTSRGRYTKFIYEPLFNQVHKMEQGWLDGSNAEQITLTTETVYDYQEGPITNLVPVLARQVKLGFGWATNIAFALELAQITNQLRVPMGVGDVNGDGSAGLTGLPSVVYLRSASGSQETVTYRWNRGGRLIWVQGADGAVQAQPSAAPSGGPELALEYFALGSFSGASSANNTGLLALRRHKARRSWPSNFGPSSAPCPHLPGPYQWLLPGNCSSANLAAQLVVQRHIPQQLADAIVAEQATSNDPTTRYEYFVTGHLRQILEPDERLVEFQRDVDGRVLHERLKDNGAEHSRTDYGYDQLLRPTSITRVSSAGPLGATIRAFDEEDRLIYECHEFVTGGCVRPSHGFLPAAGRSVTRNYTREGRLAWSMDAEGLVTSFTYDPRGWVTGTESTRDYVDGTRTTSTSYNDDGQATEESAQGGLLWKKWRYDGYGRLVRSKDFQDRWFRAARSARDVPVRIEVAASEFGTPLWFQWVEHDEFGRSLRRYTNGATAGELTAEFSRMPGGFAWRVRGYGQRPVFLTSDAQGGVAWSADDGNEVSHVALQSEGLRLRASATVRSNNQLTTASIEALDVLGNVSTRLTTGGGAGRPLLERSVGFVRDGNGFVRRQDDPDGKVTEFVVDFGGRLREKIETIPSSPPAVRSTLMSYDRRGALLTTRDLNGEVTSTTYNSFGQPETRTAPAGSSTIDESWTYDALGRVRDVQPGSGVSYRRTYNSKNQLVALVINDGQPLRAFAYDGLGRLQAATNYNRDLSVIPAGERVVESTLAYDWLGRLDIQTTRVGTRPVRTTQAVWGVQSTANWNPVTRQTARPDGTTVTNQYDDLGRLDRLIRGPSTTDFDHLGELLLEQTTSGGGSFTQTLNSIDGLGQGLGSSTQVGGSNVLEVNILRDQSGRVASYSRRDWRPPTITTPDEIWRGYRYDAMRRIEQVLEAPAIPSLAGLVNHQVAWSQVQAAGQTVSATSWTYTREANVGSVETITSPIGERLMFSPRKPGYQLFGYKRDASEPNRLVSHDTVGRITNDGIDSYAWSELSELRRAGHDSLQYDGFGRLVARYDYGSGALNEELVYDGNQMVASLGASGTVRWSATWGAGLDELVSVKKGDDTYLALSDGRGSVGGFIHENTGRVAATLDYSPEGRVHWKEFKANGSVQNDCDQLSDPKHECFTGPLDIPFGLHGAFKSDGSGLVYFRNRWFSTRTGEWISRDPLGNIDSTNLYAFNGFDSVNHTDRFGLSRAGPGATKHDFPATMIVGKGSDQPIPYDDDGINPDDEDSTPELVKTPVGNDGKLSPATSPGGAASGPLCDAECRLDLRNDPTGFRQPGSVDGVTAPAPARHAPRRGGGRGRVMVVRDFFMVMVAQVMRPGPIYRGVKIPKAWEPRAGSAAPSWAPTYRGSVPDRVRRLAERAMAETWVGRTVSQLEVTATVNLRFGIDDELSDGADPIFGATTLQGIISTSQSTMRWFRNNRMSRFWR
jgi:RHS repeat-associated protein